MNSIKYCLMTLFLNLYASSMCSQILVGDVIEGLAQDHLFGYSVDISDSGNRIVIGAVGDDVLPDFGGYVRIMDYDGSSWNQKGSLILGINDDDQAGSCVSISGNGEIVAIGAPRYSGIGNSFGHIRVFQWDGSDWIQLGQDIHGEFTFDEFGRAIDLNESGSRMVIGNYQSDPNGWQSGLVKVFDWNGSNWVQLGQTINGANEGDRTGEGVCINSNGNRIAIGSPRSDINGEASGEVNVYEYDGSQWIKIGQTIVGEGEINFTGESVAFNADGTIVLIGEHQNGDNGNQAGQARVFMLDGNNWTQMGSDLNGEAEFDLFGFSTAMNNNGTIIGIGTPYNDGNGSNSGHVRFFQWNGNDWVQIGADIDGTAIGDASAYEISLNAAGDRIIIGSPYNDDNGEDSGHVRVFLNDNLQTEEFLTSKEIDIIFDQRTDKLSIKSSNSQFVTVNIYSLNGKRLKMIHLDHPQQYLEFQLIPFSSGTYLAEVVDEKGISSTKRFVKR